MAKRVVVIGGGASGLMAAITAARKNAAVTVVEHKDRVGKKILMTGNGKCNLTNMSDFHGKYFGNDVDKIYSILKRFSADDTRKFFREIGLYTKEKRDGGVYPVSEQATSVLDVLRTECEHLGIHIMTGCEVDCISPNAKGGTVKTNLGKLAFDSLILATGGQAAAVSGSDGSGYRLAKQLGHEILKPLPALVQLRCEGNFFKSVAGVRAQAFLQLFIDGNPIAKEEGELQLTDYGISGIPVFQFSRIVARALQKKQKCEVEINFMTYVSETEMKDMIKNAKDFSYKTVEEWLSGMVHKKIAALICRQHKISNTTKLSDVSEKDIRVCMHALQHFRVVVKETNPFENAQVCSGGVLLRELDADLQSLKCPHVFMTGELLDCDGICGGYNLQWAWATGAIAGVAAAK